MKEKNKIWINWKLWSLLAIVVVIVLGIVFITNNLSKETNSSSTEEYNVLGKEIQLTNKLKKELYEKVKEDITKDLKTPSSAVFPKMEDWNIKVNTNNVIEVKSYVDSQNSFGAMLRANFEQKYVFDNENEYLCIYKEFDNKTQFDITETAENKNIINKRLTENDISNFIKKAGESPYNTLYNKIIDYNFNEEEQKLEWNIKVKSQTEGDLKNKCYLALTSAIDECVCIPTVTTHINVYLGDTEQKIATVSNIDFKFMIKKWNNSCTLGINATHLTTNFEEELGDNLVQEDIIKNMKVDYWNK